MSFRLGGFLLGAFLVFPATRADAHDLTYVAPAECPSEASVVGRLRERSERDGSARLHIERSGSGYSALVSSGDDPEFSRTMTGDTCEGVVEAALLVLAMTSSADEIEAPKGVPPEPPVAPAVAPAPDRADQSRRETEHALPFAVATGLTFAADAFSEGRWSFDLGLSVAFEWRRGALDVSWLKPRLAVGASSTPLDLTIRSPLATSEYSRLMGFVEACPTSHEIGQSVRLAFRPCGRVTGSLVSLETTSLIDPDTIGGGSFKTGTLSTAGALGRLRLSFAGPNNRGKASARIPFVEIFGGVDFTLTADRFRMLGRSPIGPDDVVASVGLVTGTSW